MSESSRHGFLSRWSQRKIQAREERNPDDDSLAARRTDASVERGQVADPVQPVADPPAVDAPAAVAAAPSRQPGAQAQDATPATLRGRDAPPSLEDVSLLTPDSDFSSFVARGVAPAVKNAAMKKLFADPHFNVMDGLDIYIDDYTQREILPESMMRKMASSKFLKMFADEDDAKPQATDAVVNATLPDAQGGADSLASPQSEDAPDGEPASADDADMVSSSDTPREALPGQDAGAAAVQHTRQEGAQDMLQLSVSPGLPTAFAQVQNQPKAPRTSMIESEQQPGDAPSDTRPFERSN